MHRGPRILFICLVIPMVLRMGVWTATAQSSNESYWGENTLRSFARALPGLAIAVCVGLLLGGMSGLYEMNIVTVLLLCGAIAILVFRFYWHPIIPPGS